VCDRPSVHEVEPAFGDHLPAVTEPDVWTVVMRNGRIVDACHACWMKWPDGHKFFPARGFGRQGRGRVHVVYDEHGELVEYELLPPNDDGPKRSDISIERLVEILRETAP
jgi:hypothetical protein